MQARLWRRPTRVALVVGALVAGSAATALGLWGTRWTVPQAPSSGASYTLRATWDGDAIPGGKLQRPIGIAVAPSGDVYVTDARLRVVRFSPDGTFQAQWGREGDGQGEFSNPVGVAVGRDGTVYVSDYEQDRIQQFTASGEFLREFGRSGSAAGEFSAPADLAVDEAGTIYVADFYNHRVQTWREDGSFQSVIGHAGRIGLGALHYPTGVAITAQGELLVADAYNYQLQWFDRDGQPRRRVGYHLLWLWPRPVTSTAGFFVPTDAATDAAGVIHVADSGNHRVVMLSQHGEYVTEWRIPDADPNVYSPEHVAVSPDGATLYATDLAGNRVLVLTVTAALQSLRLDC
jgi:DNA-binding beta-propeller fold protein YncE